MNITWFDQGTDDEVKKYQLTYPNFDVGVFHMLQERMKLQYKAFKEYWDTRYPFDNDEPVLGLNNIFNE